MWGEGEGAVTEHWDFSLVSRRKDGTISRRRKSGEKMNRLSHPDVKPVTELIIVTEQKRSMSWHSGAEWALDAEAGELPAAESRSWQRSQSS